MKRDERNPRARFMRRDERNPRARFVKRDERPPRARFVKPDERPPRARFVKPDEPWMDAVASALEPRPMDANRARAFRLAIDRRIERPRRPWWPAGLAIAATAALALALWVDGAPPSPESRPTIDTARREPAPVVETKVARRESAPTASIEPLWDGTLAELEDLDEPLAPRRYLPSDYVVLASFVER